jgi:hypothetical protein
MHTKIKNLLITLKVIALIFFTSNVFSSDSDIQSSRKYKKVVLEIEQLLETNLYDPTLLKSNAYLTIKSKVRELAENSSNEQHFIKGFNQLWQQGPFSHVNLSNTGQNSIQMAKYFDHLKIGGTGVSLTFNDNTAVLTVTTMMGIDTIEQIQQAYSDIAKHKSEHLIIDLRHNEGGAFAIVPLVSHILSEGLDAGVFVSKEYALNNIQPVSFDKIDQLSPWEGWSLTNFWNDAMTNGLTRIRFEPKFPNFSGQVYVLVSNKTASAAELATDAMQASKQAIVIGEQTAGKMLTQKPFDLNNGWLLFLPFADYISKHSDRIEGKGIKPDVATKPEDAMSYAMKLITK